MFGRKKDKTTEREMPIVDLRVPRAKLEFGLPTPCPSCGEAGYLDSIDLTERRMYQHCPSCFTKWETTEDELASTG